MAKINIPKELLEIMDSISEQEKLNEQYDLAMSDLKENRKRFETFKKEKEIQAMIKQKRFNHE